MDAVAVPACHQAVAADAPTLFAIASPRRRARVMAIFEPIGAAIHYDGK